MKRAGDDLDRVYKRIKLHASATDYTPLLYDPQQERNVTDLLQWTGSDSGYISGTIHMKWDLKTKFRVILQIFSIPDGKKQFDVEFSGRCYQALKSAKVDFKLQREIHLSLKGAQRVEKKGSASNKLALPILLDYAEDTAFEILPQGQQPGCQIDTFFKPEEQSTSVSAPQDAWFLTPKDTRRPALTMSKGDLMDIVEEPDVVSPQKSASRPAVAPTQFPAPLHNIGNSLATVIIPRPPSSNPPTSSPSSSRSPRTVALAPVQPGVVHISTPKENPIPRNDSWSGPPKPIRPPNSSTNHASTSKLVARQPAAVQPPIPSRPPESEPSATSAVPSVHPVSVNTTRQSTEEPEQVLNKKQRKNKTRREKKKAKTTELPPPSISAATTPAPPDARLHSVPNPHTRPVDASPSTAVPTANSVPQAFNPPQSQSAPILPNTESGRASIYRRQTPPEFSLLSEVTRPKLYSLIGVITYITSPSRTTNGDWSCCMRIVDPSNCIESFPPAKEGLTVNCFTKKYAQWLPAAQEGDIVILSNAKERNGNFTATGYNDKMKWAVYSLSRGTFEHGTLPAGVPKSEGLDDGFGIPFSPFYNPTTADSVYCVELSDWWRDVTEKRQNELGTVHQIGGTSTRRVSAGRQHLQISELPDEGVYFDCTVEVCHGYTNDSDYQPYSLYVTDYTPLSGGYLYQQNWCPPKLADHILKIEMWDAARSLGPGMCPGELYHLRNVRAVTSKSGYREAKIVETKVQKLDPSDVDTMPHLKALLERKQAFGLVDEVVDSEVRLIETGNVDEHITCVVELLHTAKSKYIYVSDYTRHPKISAVNEPWARGLDGYVLKVLLADDQAPMIENLVVGQYYQILHLRLQQSVTGTEFRGRIGGTARLIHPINPKSSSVSEWKDDLIKRRTKLRNPTDTTPPSILPRSPQITDVSPSSECISINHALSGECPPTFCVRARVIDFFPFRTDDSFVRSCTKCNTKISEKRMGCYRCDDVEFKHVKIVCVLRLLISDGNDKLKISVSNDIPLLAGVQPAILREGGYAARLFSERLKPLLGNLVEVHDAKLMSNVVEPNGPMMTLTIDRWKAKDGDMVYGLRDYQL